MKTSVESFIQSENVKNFKKRLEASTDEAQRRVLLTLLAEERAKAEPLAKPKPPT
jgi:hypothetical protein